MSFLLESGYLAPFVVLVLCGFGLPVPEEITFLGAGFLLYQGEVELVPMIAVCVAGTLIGDSVPFWVGRRFGRRALRVRAVRRAVHPERLRAIQRLFRRQGARAVFACRFIPGLRVPAWFTAGTLGMPYHRFLVIDAIGALVMVPIFVLLGRASGEKIAELQGTVESFHQVVAVVALALLVTLIGHLLLSKRWPKSTASDGVDPMRPAGVETADEGAEAPNASGASGERPGARADGRPASRGGARPRPRAGGLDSA
ncbi:MAG: DedA family protein [Planctomycetota bacterium]